jgi:hypothetical protein
MMKFKNTIAISMALLILASCGSSTIILTNTQKPYNIYVNNVNRGKGVVKVQRAGLPKKMTIDVKNSSGETIVHEVVRRDINVIQFAVGFLYLYPLWFWSWKYDKVIEIYIPKQNSDWDAEPSKSKWD